MRNFSSIKSKKQYNRLDIRHFPLCTHTLNNFSSVVQPEIHKKNSSVSSYVKIYLVWKFKKSIDECRLRLPRFIRIMYICERHSTRRSSLRGSIAIRASARHAALACLTVTMLILSQNYPIHTSHRKIIKKMFTHSNHPNPTKSRKHWH